MKNYDFKEKQFQVSDSIDINFECVSSCDTKDVICISRCVETLNHSEN